MNTNANAAYLTDTYDPHTNRLTKTDVDRTTAPKHVDEVTYTYDAAGLVTQSTDTHNDTSAETQCYDYDLLARLTTAWTATDNCAADLGLPGATNATVGSANGGAYWSSYTYNTLGDRTQQVDHQLAGQTGDTTTTYTYPTTGSQPNTLTGTTTTGPSGTSSTSYGYDPAGNTTGRTTPANGAQTLTWANNGQLSKVVAGASTTIYSYDADGNILVQRDPSKVTLYLPDEQLVLNAGTSTITGTRYYTGPGGVTGVRTGTTATAYNLLLADPNGTAHLALDHTGQIPTWRQYTPYGASRGTAPGSWPDTHQYLDKPADAVTGLDLFGARQYDPTIGRFVSADPMFGPTDPNQIGEYTYSGDDPINKADPTGDWGIHIHINVGKVLKAVATVASIVSIVPGPIGMIAAGVSAVAYAATGDWKNAAMMAGGLALAAVGAGAAAVVAVRAAKVAEVGAKAAKAVEEADEVVKVAKDTDEAVNVAKDADEAAEAVKEAGSAEEEYPRFNWFQRRILSRAPEPNGTIADLRGVYLRDVNNTAESALKQESARSRGVNALLKSVFRPKDGAYMALMRDGRTMDEGNHRAWRLLQLANDKVLPESTPIYVFRLGLRRML